MRIIESPDILIRLRGTVWEFQQTFQTPLKDLPRFVTEILSRFPEIHRGSVEFVQIVFDPHYGLIPLAEKYSLGQKWSVGLGIEADGVAEVVDLLAAVLSEWIDCAFEFLPDRLAIYADHDEYITFFVHREQDFAPLAKALVGGGFRPVDYVRHL
jgi:hypothetical protein